MLSLRSRYVFLPALVAFVTLLFLFLRLSILPPAPPAPPPGPEVKHKVYKAPKEPPPPPLPEYFPLAASAKSPSDLPPVPSWNKPPTVHVPETTRLYIGFTRYWPLLQQVVVSYIAAGWPPEDIYVVENTGTFDANRNGQLSSSNPFYMDYNRLTKIFGVNVLTTPSLQSFAQLQNLYLSEAINNNLTYYFWGHMDVVAQTHEQWKPYRSLYQIAVDTIRESMDPEYGKDPETGERKQWAIRFFSYDWFALVNVDSYVKIGGWDSMISYYGTDCDMHSRIAMNGFTTPIADAGQIFDVGRSLDDLEILFRRKKKTKVVRREAGASTEQEGVEHSFNVEERSSNSSSLAETDSSTHTKHSLTSSTSLSTSVSSSTSTQPDSSSSATHLPPGAHLTTGASTSKEESPPSGANAAYLSSTEEDELGGPAWQALQDQLESMAQEKRDDPYRNSWQLKQRGGKGEPFYYDADGWEQALQMTIKTGGDVYEEKWGHRGCGLGETELVEGDQWRVEHDF